MWEAGFDPPDGIDIGQCHRKGLFLSSVCGHAPTPDQMGPVPIFAREEVNRDKMFSGNAPANAPTHANSPKNAQ